MRKPFSNTVALIPARGGSKGLPRKNVIPLHGQPLISWTIKAALKADGVDRVIVTTDDAEIAEASRAAGAEVIDRPAELASDIASSEAALMHALDHLEATEGEVPEYTVFLQCTAPLTLAEDITGLLGVLKSGADSALAVTAFHGFLWKDGPSGSTGINHTSAVRQRRQDRETEWLETGSVYAFRTAPFRAAGHRFFGRISLYPIPSERTLEIDEPMDLEAAAARMVALGWIA